MANQHKLEGNRMPDDRILPLTRFVAAVVIPFLLAAFMILYLPGGLVETWFAWPITPPLTAAIMGAGYLAGAYFFLRVLTHARWHHVAGGYWPVTVFTAIMLMATLLHWSVFDTGHWPFWVWLALYIITPLLVPLAWWRNRSADPGTPDMPDVLLPPIVRPVMLFIGVALLTAIVIFLVWPERAIAVWPWKLSPLTARVMAGWQSLLAVGAITLAGERRWSGWRIPLQSIIFWQVLNLAAFFMYRDSMAEVGLLNWYVIYTVAGLMGAVAFTVWAEAQARRWVKP